MESSTAQVSTSTTAAAGGAMGHGTITNLGTAVLTVKGTYYEALFVSTVCMEYPSTARVSKKVRIMSLQSHTLSTMTVRSGSDLHKAQSQYERVTVQTQLLWPCGSAMWVTTLPKDASHLR